MINDNILENESDKATQKSNIIDSYNKTLRNSKPGEEKNTIETVIELQKSEMLSRIRIILEYEICNNHEIFSETSQLPICLSLEIMNKFIIGKVEQIFIEIK